MNTETTFRTLRRQTDQLGIRSSAPVLILLVALAGVFIPISRTSSAKSGPKISNNKPEAGRASNSPAHLADKSVPSSFAALRDYLLGDSDSPLQQAPLAGVVEIFAANCTTPQTDFNLGDTVCGKITDAQFAQRRFSWNDAIANRQTGPNMATNPDFNSFVLPATRTSSLAGGTISDNRATWKLNDQSTADTSVQGTGNFRVHEPGHPAVDLQIFGNASQSSNQITYSGCVLNQGGPDAALNTKLQMTIPNNTTFVSTTPANGSWSCAAPVGGTVICSRASLPITGVSECSILLVSINAGTPNQSQLTCKMTVSSDLEETYPRTNVAVTSVNATTATVGVPAIGYEPGAISLSAESCSAANAVVDPGETVTASLCAHNYGNADTGATLLGTLQPIGGVINPSAAQTYGVIAAGASVCRNFTFTVAALPCGSVISPIVVFTEGATPRGTALFGSPPVITGTTANGGISVCCSSPTAAPGVVSGTITDGHGAPIEGATINLTGTQTRKTITDANGRYRFDNVESNGFYAVTPSRANYEFNPTVRSFSQLGESTEAAFTGNSINRAINPLDTAEYFVRQHYLDFLGREPDESGFNFWSNQILGCGADTSCIQRRTINVSAAYFLSVEFQQTGGLVDGLYRASYGRTPRYAEFMPDTAVVARDVIVGRADWAQQLEANKQAFVAAWLQRADFRAAYDGLTNTAFVDTLISHTAGGFNGNRDALVNGLNDSSLTRAEVLRRVVENEGFVRTKTNEMFVMMEYFGYLRRDPDASGFAFWLNKLNQFNGNFEQAEMVKAFIVSGEYRDRFPR